MSADDARARISSQATDEQRRAVADVWLENSDSQGALVERARELWYQRILPFAHNLRMGESVRAKYRLVPYDSAWPAQARRIIERLKAACGHHALRVDHIGSTAVRGLDAKDVIDVQITVRSLPVADEIAPALRKAGYPRIEDITRDTPKPDARSTVVRFDHSDDASLWHKTIHASADPGRPTHVHVRVDGWPNQQFALLFTDWLMQHPDVEADYLAAKRAAQDAPRYADAKEPWFLDAYRRAWAWADAVSWRPRD